MLAVVVSLTLMLLVSHPRENRHLSQLWLLMSPCLSLSLCMGSSLSLFLVVVKAPSWLYVFVVRPSKGTSSLSQAKSNLSDPTQSRSKKQHTKLRKPRPPPARFDASGFVDEYGLCGEGVTLHSLKIDKHLV